MMEWCEDLEILLLESLSLSKQNVFQVFMI